MLDFVVDPSAGLECLCLWGRGEVVQVGLKEPESLLYGLFLATSSELSLYMYNTRIKVYDAYVHEITDTRVS